MRGSRNALLLILSEGMLLSWVYAWASLIMPMAGRRPFPLLEGALTLALATLISLLHRGRGWRVIYIITLHAAALLLAALRMIYVHFEWSHSFWSREWVVTLLAEQRTVLEWFILLLILFWAVVLWIGAIKIALKSVDLSTMGSRFDLGTALFLLLLLIQLVMLGKGVPLHPASNGELSFLAFFVLALLGLGMARHEASAEKSYMAAYRGIGVILSFVVFAFLFGGGLVILFLPALMDAAELGHGLLKAVARPVLPILVAVLRVLLISGCHRVREDPPSAKSKDAGPDLPSAGGEEGGILEQIMIWGFAAMGVLLGLGILVVATWYLVRWLSSRRPEAADVPGLWDILLRWIALFKTMLLSLLAGMKPGGRGLRGAGYPYALLLRWGSHCGLPHVPNETPLEYGSRLLRQFPMLSREIAFIVDLFNQTVYGGMDPDESQLTAARRACRRLRSPLLWPFRLRAWFVSPGV